MNFDAQLRFGQTGESLIARWLRRRGNTVLPVYEKIIDSGKGPQLFLPDGESLIAPDMFVFKTSDAMWIEAKHKTAFSWYRIKNQFETGIDLRHYNDYLRVDDMTPWPVWLLFLHRGGQAKDSPPSPSGLYGNTLSYLRYRESHRSDRHGTTGMVYWGIHDLIELASLKEVEGTPTLIREQSVGYIVNNN